MAISQFFYQFTNTDGKYENVPLIKEFAHGVTIKVASRSAQIMSDVWDSEVYAEYWDENSQSVKHAYLYYAYESGEWESKSHAEVDATPEVWAKVEEYYFNRVFEQLKSHALSDARKIRKDSLVKVTSGRYNKGAEGKVIVVMEKCYGMGYRASLEHKLGIATSDVMIDKVFKGKVYKNHRDVVWAWARNCELTVVPDIDTDYITEQARNRAQYTVNQMRGLIKNRGIAA